MAENKTGILEQLGLKDIVKSTRDQILEVIRGEVGEIKKFARPLPKSHLPNLNFLPSPSVPVPFLGTITASLGGGADGLFRVPNTDYFLELYFLGELITTIGFPFNPRSISINTAENVSLTHTQGRVFRESGFNRVRNISITGDSGFAERLGYARDGGYIFENGEVIMHEFEEFLKAYNYICSVFSSNIYSHAFTARTQNIKSAVNAEVGSNRSMALHPLKNKKANLDDIFYLTLRCVKEDINLKVEIRNYNYGKNASSNKFGYKYNLDLVSYGVQGPGRRTSLLTEVGENVSGYIRKVAAAAALVQAIQQNFIEDAIDPIVNVSNALITSTNEIQNAVNSFGINTNIAIDKFKKSVNNIDIVLNKLKTTVGEPVVDGLMATNVTVSTSSYGLKNAENDFSKKRQRNREDAIKGKTNELDLSVLESEMIAEQLGLDVYQNINKKQNDNYNAIIDMLEVQNYFEATERRKVELGLIQVIRNDFIDSRENFKSFIKKESNSSFNRFNDDNLNFAVNDMRTGDVDTLNYDLYALKDGEDLKDVSKKIYGNIESFQNLMRLNNWLDASRKADGSFACTGDIIKIPAGRDISVFSNDNYEVDIAVPYDDIELDFVNNDLKLVRGLKNLNQSIRNNLLSYTGEILEDIEYGLAGLVGVPNLDFVRSEIRRRLLADERISNVDISIQSVLGDSLIVGLKIKALNGEIFDFNTPIEFSAQN